MTMTHQRKPSVVLRGLAMLVPGGLGWLIYQAAIYLVRRSEIEIRLSHAGFGFVSDAAEIIYSVGPVGSVVLGLFFGLLGSIIYLRRGGSFLVGTGANVVAALVLVLSTGFGFLFPLPCLAAFCLWTAAVIWVLVRPVSTAQPCASPPSVS